MASIAALCTACAPPAAEPSRSAPAVAPTLEAIATVQDLMRDEVDASADAIWDSVGSITSTAGTVERQPHTEAEWNALRRNAVVLVEATNLLVVPGRRVAATPFPSDGPGVLSSAQIQQRLDDHRAEFDALALALRGTARQVLAAIDARDPVALLRLGEQMDSVCETCHLANWYPHEVIPPLPADPAAAP